MFGKRPVNIVVRGESRAVPYEKTVIHKYAPTTEQAQHLEDLQKQAWDTITDKIVHQTEDNTFICVEVRCDHDVGQMEEVTRALFTMNGKKFDVEARVSDSDFGSQEFYQSVAEALSKDITQQLMANVFSHPYRRRP